MKLKLHAAKAGGAEGVGQGFLQTIAFVIALPLLEKSLNLVSTLRILERAKTGGDKMKVKWIKDAETALAEAKSQNKPLLVDFSAAPA